MRYLFLLCFMCQVVAHSFDEISPSTADEIASLNEDLLIEGFVSALSGQISLSETDLRVKGAQDVYLKKLYVAPQICGCYDDKEEVDRLILGKALNQLNAKGWVVFPHLQAGYNHNSSHFQVRDLNGVVLEFALQGNRGILQTSAYGCSNLRLGEPNSAADIRNTELWIEGNQLKVIWPDGVQRFYLKQSTHLYLLEYELLPNGKALRYKYDNEVLSQIQATDPSGKYIYASISQTAKDCYTGSDGQKASLIYETREITGKFKTKKYSQKGVFRFPVMTQSLNPNYANTASYNERTLLTNYDAKAYPISCSYFQPKGSLARIQTFSTPSSSTSFSYDVPLAGEKGGATTVTHPNGSQTIYRFNSNLLLSAIENWFEGKLYNQKLFTYDGKQHISQIETRDGEGVLLLAKIYTCDKSGNPTSERLEGDFGSFSIKRTFSNNRLIQEEREDGLGYEYTYLGDTHLLTSKTTLSCGQAIRKILYTYDEANNLIQEAEEGRTLTTYVLYEEAPHLHLVEWKEERDWLGALIHKTRYIYDCLNHLMEEQHYDADNHLAYSLFKIYNEKGNLLEETNPRKQTASYQYDSRSRRIHEEPFSKNLTLDRLFDAKGRLISLREGNHITKFAYNASDELIEKTDYLGLATRCTYHPVHGKPILIEEAPTRLEIGYDAFGREVSRKDAYGALTQTVRNAYGDPIEIILPDGGKETFAYAPNGSLIEWINPDGLQTTYAYDPLGRLVSKTVGASTTTYTYNAYHLLEEKDPLGISTFYTYNLSGQKIEEERVGRLTRYAYDALGFLTLEAKGPRKTTYTKDVLGRILEKSIDDSLKTTYSYDAAGNIASVSKGYPTYFSYDPYDRLIKKVDASGAVTTISYEEGDQHLTKRIKDARGIEKNELYNAHGLCLKKEIPGCIEEVFSYDNALRLTSHDHLLFTYSPQGLKTSMNEANQRTTYWTYTPSGKLKSKTKPDGLTLSYEYTPEGYLAKMGSREFYYDQLGRLTGGTGFERELDPFGNITRERFANGLTLESAYDEWDRPTQRILPDQSPILYDYEGPFLKKITRLKPDGSLSYTHTYNAFDAQGLPLSETGLFTTLHTYDQMGRSIFQENPYFKENITYDAASNVIQKGPTLYTYDEASQLTSESGKFNKRYDKHYNCIERNGEPLFSDALNQNIQGSYDLNGNLLKPGFVYDEFDQLTQAEGETFLYDALGRRLQKGSISYFYINDEEIGAFEEGKIKELKVSGLMKPIAIEIDNHPYVPIIDVQKTIRSLIDQKTGEPVKQNDCDAFGAGLTEAIPYAYSGKRYDPRTGLLYFGKRYYDPILNRWLTPDPVGPVDHSNLYQYIFNNPFCYYDPDGQFVLAIPLLIWGAELALPSLSAFVAPMIYGAITGAVAYGGYKAVQILNAQNDYTGVTGWAQKNHKQPPYDGQTLGMDPSVSPGEGFEWKGNGKLGSRHGSWVKGPRGSQEILHPDLDHPDPIGPHWDYQGPELPNGARLFPDGSWSPK